MDLVGYKGNKTHPLSVCVSNEEVWDGGWGDESGCEDRVNLVWKMG